jgi:hypothetical protein
VLLSCYSICWIDLVPVPLSDMLCSLIDRERTATISREWILGRQEWKAAGLFLD